MGTNGPKIIKDPRVIITGTEKTNAGKTLGSIIFSCATCNTDETIKKDETWSTGTYKYKKLKLEKKNTITISGDVSLYVKEDFIVEDEVIFKFIAGASLIVYVDKKVEFKEKFTVTFTHGPDRPEDFIIYGTSKANTILIEEESIFIGGIYAPNAKIEVKEKSVITGALIGNKLKIDKKDVKITWDKGTA